MMPLRRAEEPGFLSEGAAEWTQGWLDRRRQARVEQRPAPQFAWAEFQGEKVNQLLLRELLPLTARHCAYCDCDLDVGTRKTIDHFRPKGRDEFAHLAYAWPNLFPCCDRCQSCKGEQWHDSMLKSDEAGYSFERYFLCDARDGICPNPSADPADQARARKTIEILGLDHPNLVGAMRRHRDHFRKLREVDPGVAPEEFSFRFPV